MALFHYSEMVANPEQTVRDLARAIGVEPAPSLVGQIVAATRIEAMRSTADRFVPEGGRGFFKNDAAFFATGAVAGWRDEIGVADAARFAQRMAELIPDESARSWLEEGGLPPFSTRQPPGDPAAIA
jgi:aryl sulfotransferase